MVDTVVPELLLEHRLLLFAGTLMGHGHHPDTRCGGTGLYPYHIQKDKFAAACFIPYILWLLWATYLNAYIYIFN